MALFECNSGGGGGGLDSTPLWSNPDTSASMSTLDALLNDVMENYDYISVQYKGRTADDDDTTVAAIVSLPNLKRSGTNARFALSATVNSTPYIRQWRYLDSTHVRFAGAVNASSGATANSYCIPVAVYGKK